MNHYLTPINQVYDQAKLLIDSGFHIVLDFELSYTEEYFNYIRKKLNDPLIESHFISRFHAIHSFEYNDDPEHFSPQWMLGLKIGNLEFFVSNLEEYREISKKFLLEILRPNIIKSNNILVGQNLLFDIVILAEILNLNEKEILNLRLDDLMLLSYSLDTSEKRRSLKVLADRFLDQKDGNYILRNGQIIESEWKQEESWHRIPLKDRFEETLRYNRNDLRITSAIYEEIIKILKRNKQEKAIELYRWFVPFYVLLLINGLEIDVEKAERVVFEKIREAFIAKLEIIKDSIKLIDLIKKDKPQIKKKIQKAIQKNEKYLSKFSFFDFNKFEFKGFEFFKNQNSLNFDNVFSINEVSGSNFREFLSFLMIEGFNDINLSKTEKGAYGFKKEEISILAKKLEGSTDDLSRILKNILDNILLLNSLKANLARIKAFTILPQIYKTKRLHHEYRLTGTTTGRISSVRPGVLNMPQQLKDLVINKNGKIGQIDLSSAEAKMFMMLLQNEKILNELKINPDTYSVIGKYVFEMQISKKTRPIERDIMKVGVLANMYGQGIFGLAASVESKYVKVLNKIAEDLIINDGKNYLFLKRWECIKEFEEKLAKEAIEKFNRGKIDEAQKDKILFESIQIDFLKLAVISKKRLDEQISADIYEDWINKTFFDFNDPENSYIENPVSIRLKFDQSLKGLFNDEKLDYIVEPYALLMILYYLFFKEKIIFKKYDIEYKTLHALSEFSKSLQKSFNKGYFVSFFNSHKWMFNFYFKKTSKFYQLLNSSKYINSIEKLKKVFDLDLIELLNEVFLNNRKKENFLNAIKRLLARYREGINFPIQGITSFFNSYLGKTLYKECIKHDIPVEIFNTVHDAIQFRIDNKIEEFKKLVDQIYTDTKHIQYILEKGLTSIHPNKDPNKFIYIPIGGEIEIVDNLGQTK